MLELAAPYFDLSTFADGETKRALQRTLKKRGYKAVDSGSASNGRNTPAAEQPAKKKKKAAT